MGIVLRYIRDQGTSSRAQISAATQLTKTGVTNIVDALIERGLVEELGPVRNPSRGRPASALSVKARAMAAIGVELNAFHSAVLVTDLVGNEIYGERNSAITPNDPKFRIHSMQDMIERALQAARANCDLLGGIIVAVPGFIEGNGLLHDSPALRWREVELMPHFRKMIDKNIWMHFSSVGTLSGVAENRVLEKSGTYSHSMLHIQLGVGVGGSLIVGGRLERGFSGGLGAIGHIVVNPSGKECHCGRRGCLETTVSLKAMVENCAPDLLTNWGDDPEIYINQVLERAKSNDMQALNGLEETGVAIANAVALNVSVLNPEVIFLGGYARPLAEWLLPAIHKALPSMIDAYDALKFRVDASPLGERSALVGAAQMIRDKVFDAPTEVTHTIMKF